MALFDTLSGSPREDGALDWALLGVSIAPLPAAERALDVRAAELAAAASGELAWAGWLDLFFLNVLREARSRDRNDP